VHRLEMPPAAHELGREPIEKLGMRGQLAEFAEIVREPTKPQPSDTARGDSPGQSWGYAGR
jgi:hypothetical protein